MAYLLVCRQLMGCQVSTLPFQISGGIGEGVGVGCNLLCWKQHTGLGTVQQSGCTSEMSQIRLTFEYLWSYLHNVDAQKATEVNANIF